MPLAPRASRAMSRYDVYDTPASPSRALRREVGLLIYSRALLIIFLAASAAFGSQAGYRRTLSARVVARQMISAAFYCASSPFSRMQEAAILIRDGKRGRDCRRFRFYCGEMAPASGSLGEARAGAMIYPADRCRAAIGSSRRFTAIDSRLRASGDDSPDEFYGTAAIPRPHPAA